ELLAAFGPPSGPDPDPALRWALTAVDAALARIAGLGGDADTALAFLESAIAPLAAVVPWAVAANRMACDAATSLWLLGRTDHLDAIERTVRETVLIPGFRSPIKDPRVSMGRLAALDRRPARPQSGSPTPVRCSTRPVLDRCSPSSTWTRP